jgi:dienelactone hydrolase
LQFGGSKLAFGLIAALLFGAGSALRAIDLGENPPGLWQDEASTGVDALHLFNTGRDRSGRFMPVVARSFGDFPLAGYRYLAAPIVGVFGLSPATERAVACLGGIALLVFTMLAAWREFGPGGALGALASGALLPTWILFSRYGSEAILLPATLTAALACFELAGDRQAKRAASEASGDGSEGFARAGPVDRRWLRLLGVMMIGASAYTYHAIKVFLPLWLMAFAIYNAPLWRAHKKEVLLLAGLLALLVLPSALVGLTPEGLARQNTVGLWAHHPWSEIPRRFFANYLVSLDPSTLISEGPADAQHVPGLGLWNRIDLPLAIIGVATSWRSRFTRFLVAWLLLAPIPGAMCIEAPNAGRLITALPVPAMLSGLGMVWLARIGSRLQDPKSGQRAVAALFFTAAILAWSATAYKVYEGVLVRFPVERPRQFQSRVSDAITCARDHAKGRRILVSRQFPLASLFAEFHLGAKASWSVSDPIELKPGEIWAGPAGAGPTGRIVCSVQKPGEEAVEVVEWAALRPIETCEGPSLRWADRLEQVKDPKIWASEVRALDACALEFDDDPGPLDLIVDSEERISERVRRYHVTYRAGTASLGEALRVPAYLFVPDVEGRVPAVIVYHGHGRGKVTSVELEGSSEAALARDLAEHLDYVVLAPDTRTFGEFAFAPHPEYHARVASTRANFTARIAADSRQDLALLLQHPAVDPARIAVAGISLGSWRALHLAVLHPEIRAAVLTGLHVPFSVLFTPPHDPCERVPKLAARLDMDDLVASIAPRPVMIQWGEKDMFYDEAARALMTRTRDAFDAIGATQSLVLDIHPDVAHRFVEPPIAEFLAQALGRTH